MLNHAVRRLFVAASPSSNSKAGRVERRDYCLAQTSTAFAPPSQLAPVVPSMRVAAPPAQYALAMISPAPHDA
jgi:hypothetical protein